MLRNVLAAALAIALTGLAAVFAALNPGTLRLDLAFGTVEAEKSLVLVVAVGAGWLIGLACAWSGIRRHVVERRRLQRSLNLAEQEIEALRSLPVQDAD